jgi:hypothetical protein
MKQTAVQFFALKAMYLNISPKEMHDFLDWFEQAKEMEKEQIQDAYWDGIFNGEFLDGEGYYNENYGKDA